MWRQAVTVAPMYIRRPSNEAIWKFLIVIAIGLAAGPEIVMAMEMRILLELLGAALFTTAFVVGGELVLLEIRTRVVDMFLPPAHLALLRSDVPLSKKYFAASHVMPDMPWWLGLVAIVFVLAVTLIRAT